MKKIIVTSLFFIFLLSCGKDSKNVEIKNVTFTDLVDFEHGAVADIMYSFNSLVLMTPIRSSGEFFHIYSLDQNSTSKGFLNRGKGPKEILGTLSVGIIDSLVWAYDVSKRTICYINFLNHSKIECVNFGDKKIETVPYLRIEHLNKNTIIAANCDDSNSKIDLININGNVITQFGNYSQFEDLDKNEIPAMKEANGHSAKLEINRDKNKLCLFYKYSDIIEIYNLETKKLEYSNERENEFVAEYSVSNKLMSQNKNTTLASLNTSSTSRYIYSLFSGQGRFDKNIYNKEASTSDIIHVYDWDGNFVKKLKLDRKVKVICVSSDDHSLYSYDIETGKIIRSSIE